MAIKFRIGNLVVITTDDKDKRPKSVVERELDELALNVDDLGLRIESKIMTWIKNDRYFDGFRNTYARILLFVVGALTLIWFGILAFNDPALTWWYVLALVLTVLAQQISVRYVFSDDKDELVDEYQAARRDKAYRIAYKNLQSLVGSALVIAAILSLVSLDVWLGKAAFDWDFTRLLDFDFSLTLNQAIVVYAGVVALMNLQKYWAWGMKGEPFRSKDEPNE
jgi:membrane protein implicated in regulation of membrane protease activity